MTPGTRFLRKSRKLGNDLKEKKKKGRGGEMGGQTKSERRERDKGKKKVFRFSLRSTE